MKLFISLLLLFLSTNIMWSQNIVKGEVYLNLDSKWYLNQVYVTNLRTQKTVLTNYAGEFSMYAEEGDIIRFTSILTERKDVLITSKILQQNNNLIELDVYYYEIEEVIIPNFKPSGNLKRDVLSLNKEDKIKKIKKAIGLPAPKGNGLPPEIPAVGLRNGGLSISPEAIYDLISGNRKKKKRLQSYEKMNNAINIIQKYFGNKYFVDLKIPINFVPNFLQFVYSSEELDQIIFSGNLERVKPYIDKYLPIYRERLKNSSLLELDLE